MPAEYRALWDVPGGGAGFSVFHTASAVDGTTAQEIADQIREFFLDLAPLMPDDINVGFDSEVLDMSVGGALVSVWPVTPPTIVTGGSSGSYARAQGARIDWGTAEIVAGRRLRGRTYIVPVLSNLFNTEGNLTNTTVAALQLAADTLLSNLNTVAARSLQVWSRTHSTAANVTGASVPEQGAILRSRRD